MKVLVCEMTDNPSDLLAASDDRLALHEFAQKWLMEQIGIPTADARALADKLLDSRGGAEVQVSEFRALTLHEVPVLTGSS